MTIQKVNTHLSSMRHSLGIQTFRSLIPADLKQHRQNIPFECSLWNTYLLDVSLIAESVGRFINSRLYYILGIGAKTPRDET